MGWRASASLTPNQLFSGEELNKHTLRNPEAVCNDGTRAVMYVRPWSDAALRDTWEIHLQGGGSCGSWEDCAARFCGVDYYDQSKMSSDWTPDTVGAVGIMDEKAENLLAGANHAYFYYCSSDSWMGQGTGTYTPESEEYAGYPSFTMFERGHVILASGIEELEAGLTTEAGVEMPKLTEAALVLWNGTSAGSTGARHHADWVKDRLEPFGTQVVAIFDAANDPPLAVLPEEYQASGAAVYLQIWESRLAREDHVPWVDQSCQDHHGGTADEYLCSELSYVVANHVTTPFFMRQDLQDTTELAEILGAPVDIFETYTRAGLLTLADIPETAVEEVTTVPGAYGPNCGQHVALETSDWWREATVADEEGSAYTFEDAVMAWLRGEFIQVVDDVVSGEGSGPRSDCSALDDER